MKKLLGLVSVIALSTLLFSCSSGTEGFDQYWITSATVNVHKSARTASDILGTLKLGDEVLGHISNLGALVPKEWLEIKYGEGYGYVEKMNLADKPTIDKMNALIKSAKESQVQAAGTAGRKVQFRLEPSRTAKIIETFKQPENIEIYDRLVVDRTDNAPSKQESWFKVRLADGRVGFIRSGNIKIAAPSEISQYTAVRDTVAWRPLREKQDPTTGKVGHDYIVAYRSAATPYGADFNRVELYSFDPKSGNYSTALARSDLTGKLPLLVKGEKNGPKVIEIRQLSKKDPAKMKVIEYSFPNPIKILKEYEIETPAM